MRIAQYRNFDISNGVDIGVALYVQGCHFHCEGCFNETTWSFCGGKEYTNELKSLIIKDLSKDYIKRLTILGGEPLADENFKDVLELCKNIRKPIWLYTGYTFENIAKSAKSEILNNIDVLVDGRFVLSKKDLSLAFRGSSNQRVIDIKNSSIDSIVLLYK